MTTQMRTESHEELRARWQQVKETIPALALSAHQALRAIQAEEQAKDVLATLVPSNALDAYMLCEALATLVRALEAWAYVSARLWHRCETEQTDAEIEELHRNSTEQYRRVLTAHLQAQERVFTFCREHRIVLRLGVVTQAFDVSSTIHQADTETCVSEK